MQAELTPVESTEEVQIAAFEAALKAEESRAEALLKVARKYMEALKAWKKAAQTGNVNARRKAADVARELAPALVTATDETAAGWDFDLQSYLETEAWMTDLKQAADRAGVRLQGGQDFLVAPPVVVRAAGGRGILRLGRKQWSSLRPAVVMAELRKMRDQKAASSSQEFLEGLYGVWKRLQSADRPVTRFREIYDQFCLTPGWRKENPELVFTQAIYALQRSGVRTTRKGTTFRIEYVSGKVKERDVFMLYTDDGTPLRYYGIEFREAEA